MKYYEVKATYENVEEIIYGSFLMADCVDEINAEKEALKLDGYKKIRIAAREVDHVPDSEVYSAEELELIFN